MDLTPYIIDGVRSPIGSFGGALRDVRADDLAAHSLSALLAKKPGLDPAAVAVELPTTLAEAAADERVRAAAGAFVCAADPTRLTERPTEIAGRMPW